MAESKARGLLRDLVAVGGVPVLLPAGLTGPELAVSAREQGLSGLLLAALERERPAWAGPLLEGLAAERRRLLVRGLGQLELAARVVAALAAREIRALPLKGAALSGILYDVESDRPMSDVDVLALERWPEGLAALAAAGYTTVARADHAWALRDPESGGIVELHRSITSAPGLFPLDVDALWQRRREGGAPLRALPSTEDLLLQLALHAAFQHGLVLSLVQWLDFRRLLEREPPDVSRLLALADAARARSPLAAALWAAEAVVAAPLPPALREALDLPAGARAWLLPRLAGPLAFVLPSRPALGRLRWELLAGRRAELLWRTLVLPETPAGDTRLHERVAFALGRGLRLARGLADEPPAGEVHDLEPAPAAPGVVAPEVPFAEELLRDCLASFPHVRLTVSGHCMEPVLAHGERVQLVAVARRGARLGDVVLARHRDGLRLHRLVWGPPLVSARGVWRTRADRGRLLDPPLAATDVLATVELVEGRPFARPRRPARALRSLAQAAFARLRPGVAARAAQVVP